MGLTQRFVLLGQLLIPISNIDKFIVILRCWSRFKSEKIYSSEPSDVKIVNISNPEKATKIHLNA